MTPPSRTLPPMRYMPSHGRWAEVVERAGGDGASPAAGRLRVVSWNIWFGEHRWRERLDALLRVVERLQPQVIGLQEVTPRQLERILATSWVRDAFLTSDAVGESLDPHGVLLLSRLPMSRLELVLLPTRRDRKLLCADLALARGPLRVLVTHLESGDAAAWRESQLDILQRRLDPSAPGLVVGDFNFDPARHPEQRTVDPGLVDCWRAVHGDTPGDTLDGTANAMRRWMAESDYAFRSDRILLWPGRRSGNAQTAPRWREQDIRRIGLEPIAGGAKPLYPSDHFGLVADIIAGDW